MEHRPGERLSHYRLIQKIGEGGMGIVWKAEDEKLRRVVAIKVLPLEKRVDEEGRRRFLREARAAAAVTHPSIAVVYEIDEAGGGIFIAMELIEGKSLRQMMVGKPIPLRESLRLGVEIAEGLAAAHQAKVIHRDLKPENLIVTSSGHVKILDFGLAKLLPEPAVIDPHEARSLSTVSEEMTRAGRIMGTPSYMSPEQARGLAVDGRSDLFSFGIVLYEMVTGRKPFRGTTLMDTLTAILREQPVPAGQLNPQVPAELQRILGNCLEKEVGERYQDARDLVVDLRRIKRDTDSQPPVDRESSGSALGSRTKGVHARRAGLLAAVVAGLALLTVGAWSLLHRGGAGGETSPSFHAMRIARLASIKNLSSMALSPDGRFLAYVALSGGQYGLWVRQISTGSDLPILRPQESIIAGLVFGPGADYLYYLAPDPDNRLMSALHQVPTLGGVPRKVLSDIDSAPAFSPDGKSMAFVRGDPSARESAVLLAQADGTGERKLDVRVLPNGFVAQEIGSVLAWSPDGRQIAAVAEAPAGGSHAEIVVIGVTDGQESHLGSRRWSRIAGLAWLDDGSALVVTGTAVGDSTSQVWLVSSKDGEATRITNDVSHYTSVGVSADSKIVAARAEASAMDLWVSPGDDPAAATQVAAVSAIGDSPIAIVGTLSGRIVFQDDAHVLWSISPDGTGRRRLTPEGMECSLPLVARETGAVFFTGRRDDRVDHVWKVDHDGGTPTQITHGTGETANAISPDARFLVFTRFGEDAVWKLPLDGGSPTKIEVSRTSRQSALYSPDGKSLWVLTLSGEGNAVRAGLASVPSDGVQVTRWIDWPRECDPTRRWGWTPHQSSLACIGMADGVLNIWVQPLSGGEAQPLTRFRSGQVVDFDWAPDGKLLFMVRGEFTTDVVQITGYR